MTEASLPCVIDPQKNCPQSCFWHKVNIEIIKGYARKKQITLDEAISIYKRGALMSGLDQAMQKINIIAMNCDQQPKQ